MKKCINSMANPIPWHGQNKRLTAPKNVAKDIVQDLCIFNNGKVSVSCWQLTEAELINIIQNGGKIYLAVVFGPSQPPVYVGSEDSVRELVIDYGQVWKKEKV